MGCHAAAPRIIESRAELLAHPAVQAWQTLRPRGPEPTQLVVMKERWRQVVGDQKTLVYRLVGAGAGGASVIAKRCRPATGALERSIYEKILPRLPVPTPRCYGAVEAGEECWLFLEDAGGERYAPHAPEHRALAAHWLGEMHVAASELADRIALHEAGPARYLGHLRAARTRIPEKLGQLALEPDALAEIDALLSQLGRLESRWDRVEDVCSGPARTLVHGDFSGQNVRVCARPEGVTLLPFDWEHAGWGMPAADLAQPALPSTSFLANPDLAAYGAVVRRRWPGLDALAIRRLANWGTVYRCLAALDWEVDKLSGSPDDACNLRIYAGELSHAMRAEGLG